jgi:hypothetical protein
MVVNQISLEVPNLFVRKHDLREFADAGVDPVHDLSSLEALIEKGSAAVYSLAGVGMEFDGFAVPCDRNDVFDCEVFT